MRLLTTALLVASSAAAANIQTAVDQALAGRTGTAVVMDVKTGQILAAHRQDLADTTIAKPGSAIKPFVLEALREHGVADSRLPCPGKLRIGSRELDCTHIPLNEPVDAHRALAYSCNNWFAASSRRISATDLRQSLLRFGFTVDLAADDNAKRLQALGEAGVRVTPLQLLAAYRRLALGGSADSDLAAAAEFGTAQLAQPLGISVAAKTGTTSDGAWLAGWFPVQKPRYALVVYLPAGSGGSDAAPVARQIFAALEPDPHSVTIERDGKISELPFEEYVAGVVAGEAGVMRSAESLKAMAVVARTWAAALRGRHHPEGFDFCSTTHCQEYRPAALTAATVAAVRATQGEMLWFNGRPALTYYSADCGGTTEAAQYVWPDLKAPYLIQQNDPWCRSRGTNEWRSEIPKLALLQAMRKEKLPVPAHSDTIRVISRTPSGRVERIGFGDAVVAGSAFRFAVGRQMGWNLVRSDAFEIRDAGATIVLHGTGAGHGAGMCQAGAAHMGEQGRGYREILAFYYPGTTLSRTAQGIDWKFLNGERVRLISAYPDRDQSTLRQSDVLAAEVEHRTGLHFLARPDVQVYPNAAAFRDGAGEPGWIAASTRNNVIRIQPGMDESVLRHELLHALIEQNAAPGLPFWFREGLVLCLDNSHPVPSRARQQAVLAAAYDEARSRVRKLIDAKGEATVIDWISTGLPRELNAPEPPTR